MYESACSQYSFVRNKQRNGSYSVYNRNCSRKHYYEGGGNSRPLIYRPSLWFGVDSICTEVSISLIWGYRAFNVFRVRLRALRSLSWSFESL